MVYDPKLHHRRSIHLKGYDYGLPGSYFITICAHNRMCWFGEVVEGQMQPNQMVQKWWAALRHKFPRAETAIFAVMPNHFHGLITIVGADLRVRPRPDGGAHAGAPLHKIVQWFKTMTTNEYLRGVKQYGWPRCAGRLWQRGYYEHIIRNEKSLNLIREYIASNPLCWPSDPENPERQEPASDDLENILARDTVPPANW